MPWFKVDDKLHGHKKALRAGEALALWVVAGSWSADHLTDGFIPDYVAARLMPGGHAMAEKLVDAGLWFPDELDGDDGWRFHDWDEFQPTADEVEAKREAARERMRRVRSNRQSRSGDVRANTPGTDSEQEAKFSERSPSPEPVPDPTRTSTPTVAASGDDHPPDDGFEDFWGAYPRGPAGKPGGDGPKKRAAQRWRRMTVAQRTAALDAVGHYAAHVQADGGPRACHASTWLNDERWDQWATPARASPDGPAPPDPVAAACDYARNLWSQPWDHVVGMLEARGHDDPEVLDAARSAWDAAQHQEHAA